ncbi:MAG: bifunctional demethylmenaquinone methyltransferase/2-methoxy-6-polyprenyl-1,4-benzoquinol methylase UbiE [Calditrichia bacterium]
MKHTELLQEQNLTAQQRDSGKPESGSEVWRMFDRISRRYDLLNHLLSLGRDIAWRKRLAENLPHFQRQWVLDCATGTGDVFLSLFQNSTRVHKGIGLDPAQKMLQIGRQKVSGNGFQSLIQLFPGDAMFLPFSENSFHTITIAFGIRNVQDVNRALQEMYRVLKPGGRVLILEFSLPGNPLIRRLYLFYFRHILPRLGGWVSGDYQAYRYLNQTVEAFPHGQDFCRLLEAVGFKQVRDIPLTLGVASIYRGDKT